jgi:Transposase IS4
MDNWFMSIPLVLHLAKLLIWCCGTVRVNRTGLCKEVIMKKSEESTLKKPPGTIRYASIGFLCFISWFAKRAVHIVTNCYQPLAAVNDGLGTIKHWFSEKGQKVQKEISRPPAVAYYNLYMGAVDMFDQYRSYVQVEMRSRKFWHPLFWFVIESALINSWLLYKTSRQLGHLPVEYTLFFTFRKSVALALAAEWENMGCRSKNDGTSPSKKM